MKILPILVLVFIFFSCSKSEINSLPKRPFSDTAHILQKIGLYATITKPSPYDSAHNFTTDSLIINYNRLVGPPDRLQNQNVYIGINAEYFSFSIGPTNYPIFSINYRMLPDVNSNFAINKIYQNTYVGDYATEPFFLSMHEGKGIVAGLYFLSQDSIPSDANSLPQVRIECKLIFSKKYSVPLSNGNSVTVMDGKITGSYEARYGKFDINKYVKSFDYSCSFQGLTIPN